jgi:hypothetical protein
MNTYTCFCCGADCATANSEAQKNGLLCVGFIGEDPWCGRCLRDRILGELESGLDRTVYISGDGRTFTTWDGHELGKIEELGEKGGIWSAQQVSARMLRLPVPSVHWSGVTIDGVHVFGRTQGHGMAASAHVRRSRGRIVVAVGSPASQGERR